MQVSPSLLLEVMSPHLNKGHRYVTNKQISFSKCSGKTRNRVARGTKQTTIPFYFFPLKKNLLQGVVMETDPFKGPCLILGNELSEETHVLTKQKTILGRSDQAESRVWEPRRTALPLDSVSGLWCWG